MTAGVDPKAAPRQRFLPAVAAVFVMSLVVANIIAVKLFQVGSLVLPAAVVIFPVSYIVGDILTEVYGYARARRVIWIGFSCNLLAVIAIEISIRLSPVPFWNLGALGSADLSQRAYAAVFGTTPRILAASFAAYLFGEFLNAFVLAKMKIATAGRHLWMRTIGSTLAGQFADSLLFITLAFWGAVPPAALGAMIVTQWLVKSAYEALATPLTYLVVSRLKRAENEDFYDVDTNFSPLIWRR